MKIFWQSDNPGGQCYYRSTVPVKFLRKNLPIEIDLSDTLSTLDYDVFLYHRAAPPPIYLKRQGKTILWELDDDLWHIPDWSPAHNLYQQNEIKENISWFLDNADTIIVSTDVLAQEVRSRTKQPVVILPNLLDLEIWPKVEPWANDIIKVLWAGSPYHEKDIVGVVPALEQLLKEIDNLVVVFFGDLPNSMADFERIRWTDQAKMIPHKRYQQRVVYVPFQHVNVYPEILAKIQADISLAPLYSCEFTRAKSSIKYYEASLIGSASVSSNLPPYQNTQSLLVDKQVEWYEKIKYLIDNPQKRLELADRAKTDTLQNYVWQSNSNGTTAWFDFFKNL